MIHLFVWIILLSVCLTGCAQPGLPEKQAQPVPQTPVAETGTDMPAIRPVQKPEDSIPPPGEKVARLTLEQALELAERFHPALTASQADIAGAAGRGLQAGLFPNPELVARLEALPLTDRFTEFTQYIIGVSQPVPLGKRLSAARQVEVADQHRLQYVRDSTRLDIQRRVQQSFVTALYWQRVIQTRDEDVQIAANGVSVAKARLEAGDAIPAEVAQAEIERHRAQLDLEKARSRQQQAMEALAIAIGTPNLQVGVLEGSLDPPPTVPPFETLVTQLKTSPFAAAAEAAVAVHQARVDLVHARRVPDITVDVAYRRVGSIEDTIDVGVRMPLNLFNRQQGALHEARSALVAAEALAQVREHDLLLELRTAYRSLSRAFDTVTQLQQIILPRAERVLRVTETRYTTGDVSISELLPVRRDWTKLRLDFLDALHEVKQAWADLSLYMKETTPP